MKKILICTNRVMNSNHITPVFNPVSKELVFFKIVYACGIVGLCADQHGREMNPTYSTVDMVEASTPTQKIASYMWNKLINERAFCIDCDNHLQKKCMCRWSDLDIVESVRFKYGDKICVTKHPLRLIIRRPKDRKPLMYMLEHTQSMGLYNKTCVDFNRMTDLYAIKHIMNEQLSYNSR